MYKHYIGQKIIIPQMRAELQFCCFGSKQVQIPATPRTLIILDIFTTPQTPT